MNQQINLYQPIFREERKMFSLRTVAVAMLVVIGALGLMWMFGMRNIARLEKAVADLHKQQSAQEEMARKAGLLLDGQGNAANVQSQVKLLSALLAQRTQALNLLRSGAAGEPKGFAPRLEALARQHTDGVWLDEVVLGSSNGLILRGRSNSAAAIPKYLLQLAGEPALSGARFDAVVFDRRRDDDDAGKGPHSAQHADTRRGNNLNSDPDDESSPTVRFSVSSASVVKQLDGPSS